MIDVLYLLQTRENYNKFASLLIESTILEPEYMTLANNIGTWYTDNLATVEAIDWDKFKTWFNVKNPTMRTEQKSMYADIMLKVQDYVPSDGDTALIKALLTRVACVSIADTALRGADGEDIDISDITEAIDELKIQTDESITDGVTIYSNIDIHDLYSSVAGDSSGLSWRLSVLNKSVGPIRKGDFVVVGKRPEVGGTTFLCSEGTHMASQMVDSKQKVLWFNNEEQGNKVMSRIYSAALGHTRQSIQNNIDHFWPAYEQVMGGDRDRITLVDASAMWYHQIDDVCNAHEGDIGLIIIDQLWKVHGFASAGNDVHRLQGLFQWARELAKKHAPVMVVHQAADPYGAQRDYLTIDDMYLSRTVIQGEADALITINASDAPGMQKVRFFNVCKNKLAGGPQSDEAFRHTKFEAIIHPEIARFAD